MHENEDRCDGEVTSEIEALLGSFVAQAPPLDRDRLMFRAGFAAAQANFVEPVVRPAKSPGRLWPLFTLASSAAALVLAVLLWQRPQQIVVVERVVEREATAPVQPPEPTPSSAPAVKPRATLPRDIAIIDPQPTYLVRRQRLINDPVEAFAQVQMSAGSSDVGTATQRELLQEMVLRETVSHRDDNRDWWINLLIPGDRS